MKIIDIIRMAIGNLRRNKMRTYLTVLGVSIGIGAIVFLVSLGFGLQSLSVKKITAIEAINVINVDKGQTPEAQLTKETVKKFKATDGVVGVSRTYLLSAKFSLNGKETTCTLEGIDPQFSSLEDITTEGGLGRNLQEGKEDEVVVTRAALKIFDFKEAQDALGKEALFKIIVLDKEKRPVETKNPAASPRLKIVGITKEDEKSYVYTNIENLEKLGIDFYSSLKVKVSSKDKIKPVKKTIESFGFPTTSIEDKIAQIDQIFLIAKIILGGFGMIALLVASIGIFNTMTIALLERTHEIGVMKAIGSNNYDIKRMFITEASIIGFLGGMLGVGLGYLVGFLINMLVNFLAVTFGGQANQIFFTPLWFTFGAVIFAFMVSTLAGIYPARRAARLNPIEALRYE